MKLKKTYSIENDAQTPSSRVQCTVTARTTAAANSPSSCKDPVALDLVAACVRRISHPGLARFVASVLHESEILEVMTRPMGVEGNVQHCLGHCIDKAARRMRHTGAHLGLPAADAIYTAALLVCIAAQCDTRYTNAGSTDVLRSITCMALHRLDDSHREAGTQLRELMGWGNDDETDASIVTGFRVRVLRLLEQEQTIQAIRTQALMVPWGAVVSTAQQAPQGVSMH